jgi:hypothetical protein
METVVYKKHYTDGNHSSLQAEMQNDIQQSFMNAEKMSEADKKKMMKDSWKLYLIQFNIKLFK